MKEKYRTSLLTLSCASSGLPLGYLPPARALGTYKQAIAFASLPLESVRSLISFVLAEKGVCQADEQFAFMALFHKIPAPFLDLRTLPRPNWGNPKLLALTRSSGLRIFASTVEELNGLSKKQLNRLANSSFELPCFCVHNSFNASTADLTAFPYILARWVNTLQEWQRDERRLGKERPALESRKELFRRRRKQANEVLSIFDSRRNSPSVIRNYGNQLAAFFGQEPTEAWHKFIAEPKSLEISKLEQLLRDVRAFTSGIDTVDELLSLAYEFTAWVEHNITEAQREILHSREVLRSFALEDTLLLQEAGIENVQEILERVANQEKLDKEPKMEHFPSMTAWMKALNKYRAERDAIQTQPQPTV